MFTSFKLSGEYVGEALVFLSLHFSSTNISGSVVSESEVLESSRQL